MKDYQTFIRHHFLIWEVSFSPWFSEEGSADFLGKHPMTKAAPQGCILWVESYQDREVFAGIWHLVAPHTPLARESKGREPCGALCFPLGFPSIWSKYFSDKESKFPSVTIWKFPNSPHLCLFWKTQEMSTDIWRSPEGYFEKIAKLNHSESQTASKVLFLGSMPDLNKQNKQKINKSSKLKGPVSNLIQTLYLQQIGRTIFNQNSKFNFKLLANLKPWYYSLTRN